MKLRRKAKGIAIYNAITFNASDRRLMNAAKYKHRTIVDLEMVLGFIEPDVVSLGINEK